jgi:hypothetical protein
MFFLDLIDKDTTNQKKKKGASLFYHKPLRNMNIYSLPGMSCRLPVKLCTKPKIKGVFHWPISTKMENSMNIY